MPVTRAAEHPTFELPPGGVRITGLASPSRGAVETIMYRIDMAQWTALPEHRHDHEEVLHLLSGSLTAVLDGERIPLEEGDPLVIPAGALHFSESGEDEVAAVVAMPSGTEFIRPDGERTVPPWGQ